MAKEKKAVSYDYDTEINQDSKSIEDKQELIEKWIGDQWSEAPRIISEIQSEIEYLTNKQN